MENELTGVEAFEQLRQQMLKDCTVEYLQMCEHRSEQFLRDYMDSNSGKVFLSFLALRIMAEAEKEDW